jgi:hypothetical protein
VNGNRVGLPVAITTAIGFFRKDTNMATQRTAPSHRSKSGKRVLTVRKDTLKDLTPDAGAPKGGAINAYAAGTTLQTGTDTGNCAAITPYKGRLSY